METVKSSCVSLQRPSPSPSNSLLFALSRCRFCSRVVWWTVPVGAEGLPRGRGGRLLLPLRRLGQPGFLVFPVTGPGRCPHDPSVKSEGSPGVREAQCFSDAGTLGRWAVSLCQQSPPQNADCSRQLPRARLYSEAVLLLYLEEGSGLCSRQLWRRPSPWRPHVASRDSTPGGTSTARGGAATAPWAHSPPCSLG